MPETNIAVLGAAGRMGRSILRCIAEQPHARASGGLTETGDAQLGHIEGVPVSADGDAIAGNADVLIDFTLPQAFDSNLALALKHKKPLVIGTTGLSTAQETALLDASQTIPILKAANMSLGVNLLLSLVKQAAAALDDSFDLEILEMHHNQKIDAPSGTALALGEAAAQGRGVALDDVACTAREGKTGARPKGEIGFATLRGGTVAGEHTVILAGEDECLELTHKATDRRIFARGAIRAALWLAQQPKGVYTINDVLGI